MYKNIVTFFFLLLSVGSVAFAAGNSVNLESLVDDTMSVQSFEQNVGVDPFNVVADSEQARIIQLASCKIVVDMDGKKIEFVLPDSYCDNY